MWCSIADSGVASNALGKKRDGEGKSVHLWMMVAPLPFQRARTPSVRTIAVMACLRLGCRGALAASGAAAPVVLKPDTCGVRGARGGRKHREHIPLGPPPPRRL